MPSVSVCSFFLESTEKAGDRRDLHNKENISRCFDVYRLWLRKLSCVRLAVGSPNASAATATATSLLRGYQQHQKCAMLEMDLQLLCSSRCQTSGDKRKLEGNFPLISAAESSRSQPVADRLMTSNVNKQVIHDACCPGAICQISKFDL